MTDEQQVRSLLTLAVELRDDIQPPVASLLHRARRRRRARAISSVLAVVILAAAAFTLPPVIRGMSHGSPEPIGMGGPARRGPAAAQLTHFRWSALPPSPYDPGPEPLLTWTGRQLLVIPPSAGRGTRNAFTYDFATQAWRTIARPPNTIGLAGAVTVWTGRELFVTSGRVPSHKSQTSVARAGLFDASTNHWTTTALPGPMRGASQLAAVWTGRDVIVGAVSLQHRTLRVAAYNPRTGRWGMITPALPARHPPVGLAMVATSDRLLLWSLWSLTTKVSASGYAVASGVDVLSLDRGGHWSTITQGWPQHKAVDSPVYANGTILFPPEEIWCGLCSHPGGYFPAELADARTLARTTVPSGPLVAHPLTQPPVWLWNGSSALAANVHTSPFKPGRTPKEWITEMAAFDPAANRWTTLPVPPGRPPVAANPIWADRQLLLLTARGGLLSFHR